MAMVINSNIQSLNAQRHLNSSLSAQNTATERLSSGLRINSAADDAAGLAIANRMTSQVKGLDMAIRNANDGVSMIQTAEGALSETTNILQRMRELSIQSANGIYDTGNRGTLNAEVQQLKAEIDRIAETTTFNGLNILDGSLGKVGLQVGEQANQTIDLDIQNTDTKTLGLGSTSVDVTGAQTTNLSAAGVVLSNNDVLVNGQSILALGETFDSNTDSPKDLIDKINANVAGVTASTITTATATTVGDGVFDGGTDFGVTVEGLDGATNTIQVTDTTDLQDLVDKLNVAGAGVISAGIDDGGYLTISAENSNSLAFTNSAATTSGTLVTTQTSIALTADDGNTPIEVTRGTSGTLHDLQDLGFRENNDPGTVEGVGAATNQLLKGDLTINGVEVGKSEDGTLDEKINAINKVSDETGVEAVAFSTMSFDMAGFGALSATGTAAGNRADFAVNGVDIGLAAADDIDAIVTKFNANTADTGITASLLGSTLVLEGNVPSINFTLDQPLQLFDQIFQDDATLANATAIEVNTGTLEAAGTPAAVTSSAAGVGYSAAGGIRLTSADSQPISIEHKDAQARLDTGLIDANAEGGGAFGASVDSLDISTAAGANKAIEILDVAIQTVSDVRGDLGAVTNRLNYTVSNLSNVSENASAAKSRIMDADFAAESANLSRAQVLQQAGNAMLAQANSRPQQVLSLLQ
jgi:flagellin